MIPARDQFDPDLRQKIKKIAAAVIPVGSLEQHGPHLSVSTDADIAAAVSARLAKSQGYLLMPAIPYGASYEHAPMFHASISTATLKNALGDIAVSLAAAGIRTVFVINGHHGNKRAVAETGRLARVKKSRVRLHAFSYWDYLGRDFDHAGFVESSLMLAVSGKTRMSRAVRGFVPGPMNPQEKKRLARAAARSFPGVTKNGVWGDPRGASRGSGLRMLDEIVSGLAKECQLCLTGRRPKLHQ